MPTIVSKLAARALRRVGVQLVPSSGWEQVVSVPALAARALRVLGVNPVASGAAVQPTTTAAAVAARALVLAGANPLGVVARSTVALDRADLALRALLKLGAVAAGEVPAPADRALAEAKLDAAHALLRAEGLADWDADATPLHAAEAVVLLAAQMLAPEFGHAADATAWDRARAMLRAAALDGPAAQAAAEESLADVQAGLRSRGVVAWAPDRIPWGAAEVLAGMVAQLLLPRWGRQGDLARTADGEARLRLLSLEGAAGQEAAEREVAAVHATVLGRGLADWPAERVPLAVADAYAVLAASRLLPRWGGALPASAAQAALQAASPGAAQAAEEALRRLVASRDAQALAEGKVVAVHAGLDARGIARWTLFDLPDWAEEPYVLMTAALLATEFRAVAPEFGQLADAGAATAAATAAELALCRAAALPSLGGAVSLEAF